MKVAYVVYPDFTALDLIGPYEVISRWPAVEVHFVASSSDPMRTDRGLTVIPTDTTETLPDPDVIVVPGSENPLPVLEDEVLLSWLRRAAPGCQWTVSICSGASLYASVGLLDGKTTATHWAFRDNVRALGPKVVDERVVWQGTHISSAGVSAGIDAALSLTEPVHGRELAEALQLVIEYDPEPPFDSGSLSKASGETIRRARRIMLGDRPVKKMAQVTSHLIRARFRRARRGVASGRDESRRLKDSASTGERR
jgi:transcriptional regulator GlxA family with amidase domain